jgi:hypothetical protein
MVVMTIVCALTAVTPNAGFARFAHEWMGELPVAMGYGDNTR